MGSLSGRVYALDAKSGCTFWTFQASSGVRSAISVAQVGAPETMRFAVMFGDLHANVYAVEASTGDLIWKTPVDPHPLARITGSPVFLRWAALRSRRVAGRNGGQCQRCLL